MRSDTIMNFYHNGNRISYSKFEFISVTHTKELEKKRKRTLSELTKIPQKNILVFVDELDPYVPKPLKNAA